MDQLFILYHLIPAISLELLFRLAGTPVPACRNLGFFILCFSGSKKPYSTGSVIIPTLLMPARLISASTLMTIP